MFFNSMAIECLCRRHLYIQKKAIGADNVSHAGTGISALMAPVSRLNAIPGT